MSARALRRAAERRRARPRRSALIAATLTGVVGLGATSTATAATYAVTNTNDSGPGSLRQAVADANLAAGADTIDAAGVSGTITLTSGELAITEGVAITGPGAGSLKVSGGGASRVVSFAGGTTEDLTISGLTIADGEAANGGGLDLTGRRVTLRGVVVSGNAATANAGGARIEAIGAEIDGSTFTDNEATGGFGGLEANAQFVAITGSSFTDNEADYVGGFGAEAYAYAFDSGRMTVTDVIVADNVGGGAVISADAADAPALIGGAQGLTVTGNVATSSVGGLELKGVPLSGATIADNTSIDNVGGISLEATSLRSSTVSQNTGAIGGIGATGEITDPALNRLNAVSVVDSTVSGNWARSPAPAIGGTGGGILATGELVDLTNSTIADNRADVAGGGIYAYDADQPANPDDDADDSIGLASTIVADNLAAAAPNDLAVQPPAPGASFTAAVSLIEAPGSAPLGGSGNVIGADPQLGPLAANGGGTKTMLPAATSPVVDAGAPNGLTVDQRGLPRTVGGGTDIGSVELQTPRGGDTSVDATATARRKQFQRGRKVKVRVVVDAAEGVDVTAGGAIGRRPLRTVEASVAAGSSRGLTLTLRGKRANAKILRALGRGKRAKANLTVELTDAAGNEATTPLTVALKPKRRGN